MASYTEMKNVPFECHGEGNSDAEAHEVSTFLFWPSLHSMVRLYFRIDESQIEERKIKLRKPWMRQIDMTALN